jgi:hypothetical protein
MESGFNSRIRPKRLWHPLVGAIVVNLLGNGVQVGGAQNYKFARVIFVLSAVALAYWVFYLPALRTATDKIRLFPYTLSVAGLAFVMVLECLYLAPKPDPNGSPATLRGIEKLLQKYSWRDVAAPHGSKESVDKPTQRPVPSLPPSSSSDIVRDGFNVTIGFANFGNSSVAWGRGNASLTRIDVVLYMRVVNIGARKRKIDRYEISLQSEKGLRPLCRVDTRTDEVFSIASAAGLREAVKWDLDKYGFDRHMYAKRIEPQDAVEGWVFFSYLGDIVPKFPSDNFRVKLYTADGEVSTVDVYGYPPLDGSTFNAEEIGGPGAGKTDLSMFKTAQQVGCF